MDCSLVIHIASHLTVEGNKVGQAQLPFCKAILTTPDHLVLLFGNAFQEDFLHHLPKD